MCWDKVFCSLWRDCPLPGGVDNIGKFIGTLNIKVSSIIRMLFVLCALFEFQK